MGTDVNPTAAVNPNEASIQALAARPDNDAIIMVNLLKFRPDGGRDAYARYGAVASGTVRERGGSIAYSAPVICGDAWDQVTLVRYPRRAAYLDMQSDPAYIGAIPDRTKGLSARLLYPFHDPEGDPDDSFRIERSGGDEVFVVRLGQRADGDPSSRGGAVPGSGAVSGSGGSQVVLLLHGDVAMVSDDRWDELTITRFPSVESVELDADDTTAIVLITQPSS
ncbi:MAG: hypothetical protein ACR2QO_06490 [Acidimicrobiales bacterium]